MEPGKRGSGSKAGRGEAEGGRKRQREEAPHHVLHLLLGGVAVADHRLLHLQRGVLGDRQPGDHRRADRGAARLAERERRLRVDVDEHLLHRDLERPVQPAWKERPHPLRDALVQVTLEQAHHVGELIAMFWQQDVEPPEMTWIDVRLAIAGDPGPS